MNFTREQVAWVRELIASHKGLTVLLAAAGQPDTDPLWTAEMYEGVGAVADACDAHLDLAGPPEPMTDAELDAMFYAFNPPVGTPF